MIQDDRDMETWSNAWRIAAMLLHRGASSSLSPQCRKSVSQGLGSFQSPGAHPSEPPAKLLLSFLHPLSLALLSFFVPFLVPLLQLLIFDSPLHFSLLLTSVTDSYFLSSNNGKFYLHARIGFLLSTLLLLFLSQSNGSFAAAHN